MPVPTAGSPTSARGSDPAASRVTAGNGLASHHRSPDPLYEGSPTFQMATRQLMTVAEHVDLDPGVLERLAKRNSGGVEQA